MTVWRLARRVYPALDGEGARLYGGRWNSPGTALVYTAGSLALAALELLVHTDLETLPDDLTAFAIEIPSDVVVTHVERRHLPKRWRSIPAPAQCARFGDTWVRERNAPVLAVPSTIVTEEFNYLINPSHSDAAAIRVVRRRKFVFDPRLLV